MNKTLMERARSMLSGAGLGQEFWAEALETSCYLVNKSPSLALEDKTPQEVWTSNKPSLSHLKEEELDSTTEKESKDEEPQTLGVRTSIRERRQPKRYIPSTFCSKFSLSITNNDPRIVKEVIVLEDGKLWKEAMVDEMASLHKNEALDLVELPAGRKPISSKWVFKKKTNAEGKVEKYKARLVAKGYSQVSGIDFGDIFLLLAT
eukprot:PITA_17839